jgi:hypothetical protein
VNEWPSEWHEKAACNYICELEHAEVLNDRILADVVSQHCTLWRIEAYRSKGSYIGYNASDITKIVFSILTPWKKERTSLDSLPAESSLRGLGGVEGKRIGNLVNHQAILSPYGQKYSWNVWIFDVSHSNIGSAYWYSHGTNEAMRRANNRLCPSRG